MCLPHDYYNNKMKHSKASPDANSYTNDTSSQFSELAKRSLFVERAGPISQTLVPVLEGIIEEDRASPPRPRCKNDIKEVRNLRQLERLELDLESPRWRLACHNIGVTA